MRPLKLSQVPAHRIALPTAPLATSHGVLRPVVAEVRRDLRIRLHRALELFHHPRVVLEVGVHSAPERGQAVGPVWPRALRAVVVGKRQQVWGRSVGRGCGEPAGLDLGKPEVDLGSLVLVAVVDGLAPQRAQGRVKRDSAQTVA